MNQEVSAISILSNPMATCRDMLEILLVQLYVKNYLTIILPHWWLRYPHQQFVAMSVDTRGTYAKWILTKSFIALFGQCSQCC